jgi:replicative DNA helicase
MLQNGSGAFTGETQRRRRETNELLSDAGARGRTPPHSIEAERNLLGALLIACGDTSWIFEVLKGDSFFSRRHQLIFEAVRAVHDEHQNVDTVLVKEVLERGGNLDAAGGLEYLLDLTEAVQTSGNAEQYAYIIHDRYLRRGLIDTCDHVVQDAYENQSPARSLLDQAEVRILELSGHEGARHLVPMEDAVKDAFELIDTWEKGETGTATGFRELDQMTSGGLHPGELIVVAGRPSMGKTTLSMNIAQNIAQSQNKTVAVFSLEVDRRQIAINLLCRSAQLPAHKLRKVDMSTREWEILAQAAGKLQQLPIFVDDGAGLNTMAIRSRARKLKNRHDLGLIVIDYLQLLEMGGGRQENRQQEISAISRSLKMLARELEVPVITISQLSRAVESRESHRPRMSDLRESGAIEQDADLILLLYRDEYYHPEKEEAKGKAEVIIAKQRNGPTGSVDLAFIGEQLRFEDLAPYQDDF